jgi:hypothetical protein
MKVINTQSSGKGAFQNLPLHLTFFVSKDFSSRSRLTKPLIIANLFEIKF